MRQEEPSFAIGARLAEYIARVIPHIDSKTITWSYFPALVEGNQPRKASNFAAVELSSGAIGIAFAAYIPSDAENVAVTREEAIVGHGPLEFLHYLGKSSALPAQRTLSMAVINALSTGHMKDEGLMKRLEFKDAVAAMNICPDDVVGMVGLFPPLIQPISRNAGFLHVIELKPELVQSHDRWHVTGDPNALRKCNKIIVTGSVLLNGTIHSLVELVAHADIVALIGPTASFLPEPLFELGFNLLGGSIVVDPVVFKARISAGLLWEGVEKFVARKENWVPTT